MMRFGQVSPPVTRRQRSGKSDRKEGWPAGAHKSLEKPARAME